MDNNSLKVKVDSSQARADLAALSMALEKAGLSANKMAGGFQKGMGEADTAVKGSLKNMERFAQAAAVINRVKIDAGTVNSVSEFASALSKLSRVKEIDRARLDSWRKFVEVGALVSKLKINNGATNSLLMFANALNTAAKTREISIQRMSSWSKFIELAARTSQLRMGAHAMVGLNMFAQSMDQAARARAIQPAKLKSWVDFITIAARTGQIKFNSQTPASIKAFSDAIAQLKVPGKASIERLERLFQVLAAAKRIPGALQISRDLDQVAQAAARAASALDRLPMRLRASMGGSSANGMVRQMNQTVAATAKAQAGMAAFGGSADKTGKQTYTLGERLRGLNHRFDLAYQAGTAFSLLFSTFTIGSMIKSIYDTGIEIQKLEKAMLFTTKSFDGSKQATSEFIGTVFQLGLSLDQVAEPFGRFTISAAAVGMTAKESGDIFKSVTSTLQVVGASAQQTGYAMYGLTQMIQKGKVSSEEFNRQIGEQIPGNAEAGRRALERLKGEAVSMQQFFKEMSLGKIMSDDFSKLWAEELDKMFSPLMAMVRDRPDVAINRFNTAMAQFRIEIGKNQFMQEIGSQFARLADHIGEVSNGTFQLKKPFQDLAERLGRNLADMVRAAGNAALWLAENFEKVLFTIKLVATFAVARTILSWGQAAIQTASSFEKLTKAILGLNVAQQVAGVGGAAAGAKGAAAAAGSRGVGSAAVNTTAAALSGASMGHIMTWRGANGRAPNQQPTGPSFLAQTAGTFGRRGQAPTGTAFTMQRGGNTSAVMAQRQQLTRGSAMARVGSAVTGAGQAAANAASMVTVGKVAGVAARALGLFGVAVVGTGAALALLSDYTIKLGKSFVKVEDVTNAQLKLVFGGLVQWFNRLMGENKSFTESIAEAGDWIKAFTDALVHIGEVVGDTAGAFIHLIAAIGQALKGDFKGAGKSLQNIAEDWSDNGLSQENIRFRSARSEGLALDAALERAKQERGNQEAEQRARQAATILAQQQAAADQLKAAEIQNAAADKMTKTLDMPSVNDVLARLARQASGQYAAENPGKTAAERTAASIAAVQTTTPAAPDAASTQSTSPASVINDPMVVRLTKSGLHIMGRTFEELAENIYAGLQQEWKPSRLKPWQRAPSASELTEMRAGAYDLARTTAASRNNRVQAENAQGPGSISMAMSLLREKEGLRNGAYWDVNHYRVGYGSDTKTDAQTGAITRVGRNTTVTTADAEADLRRRTEVFQNQAAREIGAQNWRELSNAAQAALTSVIYNYGSLDRKNGRGAGIADDIRAGATSPEAIARLVEGLQGHNNGVNRHRRLAEARMIRTGQMVGGADVGSVTGSAAETAENDVSSAVKSRLEDRRSVLAMLQSPDAASQAIAGIAQVADQLNELLSSNEERIGEYGGEASVIDEKVHELARRRFAQLTRDAADAMNPIAAGNRLLEDQNHITALLIQGRQKEAEWQEKLNEIRKQYGEDYLALMQDSAKWEEHVNDLKAKNQFLEVESLENARQKWEYERNLTKTLEAQMTLMQSINESRLMVANPRASRTENYLNDILNQTQEGGTLEQKRANAGDQLPIYQQIAQVRSDAERAASMGNMISVAQDAIGSAGLSDSQRQFRAAYGEALREMTGMTNASIEQIMETLAKEGDNVTAGLAEGYAKLMEELDNQPGFQKWVDALEPLHKRMQDIKGQFLDTLSDGITDALMGEEVDWKNIMKNIRREMVKASVDSLMGDIMGFMGIKKGEAQLSPESRALITQMEEQRSATVSALERTGEALTASLREVTDQVTELGVSDVTQVEQQTNALTIAAQALHDIAVAIGASDGDLSSLVTKHADTFGDQMTTGAGTALQGPMPVAPADLTNVEAVKDYIRDMYAVTGQVVPADLARQVSEADLAAEIAMGNHNIAASSRDGETLQPYTPGRVDPLAQATIPQASPFVNRTQNKTKWWQRAGQALLGKYWGGHETDTRFATAGRMSNAAGANSQPGISDIATSGGEGGGDSGLGQAAQALAGSASSMMQAASAFSATIPQFTAAIANFEAAIAKLAESGGGGGGGGMPDIGQLFGGGGGSSGGTGFGGQAIPEDLIGLFADGGYIAGRGGPRSDSIPARLSNGEFVINAKATAQNRPLLEAINSNSVPGFADGGEASWTSKFFGKGNDGKYNGGGSSVGKMFGKGNDGETRLEGFMEGAALVSTIMDIFKKPKQVEKEPDAVKGVIGEHRAVTVDATQIAAHSNPIADLIDIGMNMATGGTWGKVKTGTNMVASMFADGGYVGAGSVDWSSVPHYAEGTTDTSGIPAVVHPGEAIIPLSGGRKVPVEMGDQQSSPQFNSTFNIHTKDADSFRQSQGQIQRKQNLAMKRSSTRNLA